jgi:hypothetical protein
MPSNNSNTDYNYKLADEDLEKEAVGIFMTVKDSLSRGEDYLAMLAGIRRYLDTRPPPATRTMKCHELINELFKYSPHEELIVTDLKVK